MPFVPCYYVFACVFQVFQNDQNMLTWRWHWCRKLVNFLLNIKNNITGMLLIIIHLILTIMSNIMPTTISLIKTFPRSDLPRFELELLQKKISVKISYFDLAWPLEAKPLAWSLNGWNWSNERSKSCRMLFLRLSSPSSFRATNGFVVWRWRNFENFDFFYPWWHQFWLETKNTFGNPT